MRKDGFELSVAFWARPERGFWTLYLALPGLADRDWTEAARAYHDSVSKILDLSILPWVDVQMIDDREPIARDALKIADRKGTEAAIRYRGSRLGDLGRARAYIYPRPTTPVRQAFVVTYSLKDEKEHQWSATTRRAEFLRGISPKGAVTYSTAQWLGGTENRFAHVYVLVGFASAIDERAIVENPVLFNLLAGQARSMADEMFRTKHPDAVIHHQGSVK